MDDDRMRRLLGRVFTDEERWPAIGDYRPDDVGPLIDFTPADDRRFIFDLAMFPGADEDDRPDDVIAEFADPTTIYDMFGVVCRELIRLRVELDELRGAIGLGRN